jgi:biopolymer transport protein ExbB
MWYIYDYYASNGGIINGFIFLAAVIIFYVGSGKILEYRAWRARMQATEGAPLQIAGMPLEVHDEPKDSCRRTYHENLFREKLLEILPRLDNGLDTMAAFIQAAPLLGLFGTVVGMIKTFELITTYGNANPAILTEGITVSLLTTQAGLLVAFPGMLFHNMVISRKDALVHQVLTRAEKDVKRLVCSKGAAHV